MTSGSEVRDATRKLRLGENDRKAQGGQRFDRLGDELFGSALLAVEAGQDSTSQLADRDPDRLSGLDRDLVGFPHRANRVAELAGIDSGPSAHTKQLGQEPEASLGTQNGGGAIHELDRFAEVTCGIRRERQELRARRVRIVELATPPNPR